MTETKGSKKDFKIFLFSIPINIELIPRTFFAAAISFSCFNLECVKDHRNDLNHNLYG